MDVSKALRTVWVFVRKRDQFGKIRKYKARLCILGSHQKPGTYSDTSAPTPIAASVRFFFVIVCDNKTWILRQVDVDGAFLHADLPEHEWMVMIPPLGVRVKPGHHLIVKRAIYGLKQSAKRWYDKFKRVLLKIGFVVSSADEAVFMMYHAGRLICVLLCHVDDMLIGGEERVVVRVIADIKRAFPITELGWPNYFLGIEVEFNRGLNRVRLRQRAYCLSILEKAGMLDCKPRMTPASTVRLLKPTTAISVEEKAFMADKPYRELNGSIGYVAMWTRPDLAWSWSETSRFSEDPRKEHWLAIKNQLRYLKGTLDYGIEYVRTAGAVVNSYGDADHAGDTQSRRSKSGVIQIVERGGQDPTAKGLRDAVELDGQEARNGNIIFFRGRVCVPE